MEIVYERVAAIDVGRKRSRSPSEFRGRPGESGLSRRASSARSTKGSELRDINDVLGHLGLVGVSPSYMPRSTSTSAAARHPGLPPANAKPEWLERLSPVKPVDAYTRQPPHNHEFRIRGRARG